MENSVVCIGFLFVFTSLQRPFISRLALGNSSRGSQPSTQAELACLLLLSLFFLFFFMTSSCSWNFLNVKCRVAMATGVNKKPPVTWGTAIWYLSPPWGLPLPPSSHCFMGASQDAALYSKPNIGHTGSPCLTAMSGPSRWMAYVLQYLHHYFHLCRHWTWQWSERLEWW